MRGDDAGAVCPGLNTNTFPALEKPLFGPPGLENTLKAYQGNASLWKKKSLPKPFRGRRRSF
jgi:hypothetical protein